MIIKGKDYELKNEKTVSLGDLAVCERARAIIVEHLEPLFDTKITWDEFDAHKRAIEEAWLRFCLTAFVSPDDTIKDSGNITQSEMFEAIKLFFQGSTKDGK